MIHVKATGTFVKRAGHIFRTSAELSFGHGKGKKVLLIMLNPGSSRLADDSEWSKMEMEDVCINGFIELDSTMQNVCNIIQDADPKFNGTITITNLFNLRCGNMDDALKTYGALKGLSLYEQVLETDFDSFSENQGPFSCYWLAWSVRELKILFKKYNPVAKFKNDDMNNVHVWHARPLIKEQAIQYNQYITPRLRQVLT
jgi:hypothetical protein